MSPDGVYRDGQQYQPDFVVETHTHRAIIEVKAQVEMEDLDVLDKRDAAIVRCGQATEHTMTTDKKPWRHALIPAEVIADNMSYRHLLTQYECVTPRAQGRAGRAG